MSTSFDGTEDGFVFLWRKILDNPMWWKPAAMYLFMYCLLRARHEAGSWMGIELKRGELCVGRKSLSQQIPFSEQQIRTAMRFLTDAQILTTKSTNKFTIVTVCNYEFYQHKGAAINQLINQQSTSNQPAINQQVTTKKNVNTGNNGKNEEGNTLAVSPPMQPAKDDAEPKTVYGELGKVKLTAAEYANLQKKHAPSSLAAAIELLDGYIGQKKKDPYASHYAVLKDGSWVWERIAEKTRQGPRNKI